MSAEPVPVACTLTTAAAASQAVEWTDLQKLASSIESIEGGARLRFGAELEARVADLAAREAGCCAFLTLAATVADGELVFEVTSSNPDAKPVISMLAGIAIP